MAAPGVTWSVSDRLGGLRRFATAITVFNILGHIVFGFEQSFAYPLAAVATAYSLELLLEWLDSKARGRAPRYRGRGLPGLIDFLLSAHISAMACSMLLYSNERLMPIVFAVSVAICSKAILRIRVGPATCHFMNPSNFGITATLLAFPWVGIAPPYHFTENLGNAGDLLLPIFIICSGSFLNWRFTKRLPLLGAWVGVFAIQAAVRHLVFDVPLFGALAPMTGVAFVLFTFYMVTDPATTPIDVRGQVLFGGGVAAMYGVLMSLHIVFGFFFALSIVSVLRVALPRVSALVSPQWARWQESILFMPAPAPQPSAPMAASGLSAPGLSAEPARS